ncbi:hypothetical protein B0H13DRAFT_793754 [Mycena leptocephala]|nr:hypothetical protein B0H13DRAFT_793754 [Mycena leptocephala]
MRSWAEQHHLAEVSRVSSRVRVAVCVRWGTRRRPAIDDSCLAPMFAALVYAAMPDISFAGATSATASSCRSPFSPSPLLLPYPPPLTFSPSLDLHLRVRADSSPEPHARMTLPLRVRHRQPVVPPHVVEGACLRAVFRLLFACLRAYDAPRRLWGDEEKRSRGRSGRGRGAGEEMRRRTRRRRWREEDDEPLSRQLRSSAECVCGACGAGTCASWAAASPEPATCALWAERWSRARDDEPLPAGMKVARRAMVQSEGSSSGRD